MMQVFCYLLSTRLGDLEAYQGKQVSARAQLSSEQQTPVAKSIL